MLHHCVYYRRVPPFRPGEGHQLSHVLFDSRFSMHSRREVEKFSSVATGMSSETIATYMALRASMIGQQRKAFEFFVVLLSMFKSLVDQNTTHKKVQEEYIFCLGNNIYEVRGVQTVQRSL